MSEGYTVHPIGYVRSCFDEKFGVPRQPSLVPSAQAELVLQKPYDRVEMLAGLELASHIWLQFIFHKHAADHWRPSVRPPRLGGNKKRGVFATRAPYRPNQLGLSVVKLERIEGTRLFLSGVDLVDGTPVVDIKPYLPYVDSIANARFDFASEAPSKIPVVFLVELPEKLRQLLDEVLSLDPRPAYANEIDHVYKMRIAGAEVTWRHTGELIEVMSVD